MNLEDITNIDELAEFMTAEAALWGRDGEIEQKTVNGEGMRHQWENRDKFPYPVFYLRYDTDSTKTAALPDGVHRAIFTMEAMWFDEEGNVTDRPEDV